MPGRCGAVNVVQRFGSALNLNTAPSPLSRPRFHPAPSLADEDAARLVAILRERIVRLLRCRGLWPGRGCEEPPSEPEQLDLFPQLASASIQGRVRRELAAVTQCRRVQERPSAACSRSRSL